MIRILFILLLVTAARAQDGHHGQGHEPWHRDFYSTLLQPDSRTSCCSLADCRPTSGRAVGGHYEVKVNGQWVKVLPRKVVKRSAPDQGFHVCAPRHFDGKPEHLYCVVLPPET